MSPDSLIFQSTLSVRRATLVLRENLHRPGISIHALRKESDPLTRVNITPFSISIHALRKESDQPRRTRKQAVENFNPRSP